MEYKIPVDKITQLAQGKWLDILQSLAPTLQNAVAKKGKNVNCPFPLRHGRSQGKSKFRIWKYDTGTAICTCGRYSGIDLIKEANSWTFFETIEAINTYLGDPCGIGAQDKTLSPQQVLARKKASEDRLKALKAESEKKMREQADQQKKLDSMNALNLKQLWETSVDVSSFEAKSLWRYLFSRGIDARVTEKVTTALRYHEAIPFFDEKGNKTTHPGMLGILTDPSGKALTIHRTYLDQKGNKAKLPGQKGSKLLMPYPSSVSLKGGAIKLCKPNACLSVTEGIETAFSVLEATGTPTWATYSAYALENLDLETLIKGGLKTLYIWADKDVSETGQKSAQILFDRASELGLQAKIMLPSLAIPEGKKSIDWADVLELNLPFPSLL